MADKIFSLGSEYKISFCHGACKTYFFNLLFYGRLLEDLASSICSDEIKTKGQVTNQLILILSDYDFFSVPNAVLSFGVRTRHSVVYCGGIDQELFQDELFSVCRGSAASCLLPSRCQSSQLPVAKSEECLAVDEEI